MGGSWGSSTSDFPWAPAASLLFENWIRAGLLNPVRQVPLHATISSLWLGDDTWDWACARFWFGAAGESAIKASGAGISASVDAFFWTLITPLAASRFRRHEKQFVPAVH